MVLDLSDIVLRVGLAFLSGFILGMERETHGRPAGLRTIVLVCVASAIAGILSDQFYRSSFTGSFDSETWHPDPARLAAGILTGIGFLGAGVIIHHQNWIRGVTTASQIWFVTILGLCFGGGQFVLGMIGLIVSIITVYFLRKVEIVIARDSYATLIVTVATGGAGVSDVIQAVQQLDVKVKNTGIECDADQQRNTLVFELRFRKSAENVMPERVISHVSELRGVTRAHWK